MERESNCKEKKEQGYRLESHTEKQSKRMSRVFRIKGKRFSSLPLLFSPESARNLGTRYTNRCMEKTRRFDVFVTRPQSMA